MNNYDVRSTNMKIVAIFKRVNKHIGAMGIRRDNRKLEYRYEQMQLGNYGKFIGAVFPII